MPGQTVCVKFHTLSPEAETSLNPPAYGLSGLEHPTSPTSPGVCHGGQSAER